MDFINNDLATNWLKDVSCSQSQSQFNHTKSIVVLGDDLSGKSTLTSRLVGNEDDSHHGSALDFQTFEVQGDDVDDITYCKVWTMDGHLAYRSLLQYALPVDMVSHTLAILVVDMSQPWNIPESLDKWVNVLFQHIKGLGKLHYKSFNSGKNLACDDPINIHESVLHDNEGVELAVVCTKCDLSTSLETKYDYKEEHFDFIQYHLRKFCLQNQASLIYTGTKEVGNYGVLKEYALHKLYGFSFDHSPCVVGHDSVFVPVGWDTDKKINILSDTFAHRFSGSEPFDDIIKMSLFSKPNKQNAIEITVEDEQDFLAKAQLQITKTSTSLTKSRVGGETGLRTNRIRMPQTPSSRLITTTSNTTQGVRNEEMLANFFKSLLDKKSGPTP